MVQIMNIGKTPVEPTFGTDEMQKAMDEEMAKDSDFPFIPPKDLKEAEHSKMKKKLEAVRGSIERRQDTIRKAESEIETLRTVEKALVAGIDVFDGNDRQDKPIVTKQKFPEEKND